MKLGQKESTALEVSFRQAHQQRLASLSLDEIEDFLEARAALSI
jgi:hypothetical protein